MPYAPGVQLDTGILTGIGRQIAGFGENIANTIERHTQEANKAKSLRAALAAYAPDGDAGKAYIARLQTIGLPELEGEVQKQAITRAVAEFKQNQERNNVLNAQSQLQMEADAERINASRFNQQQGAAYNAALQKAVAPRFEFDGSGQMKSTPLTPEMLMQVSAPFAGTVPAASDAIDRAMKYSDSGDSGPQQVMIGDVPYVWKKGSGQFGPRADFVPGLKHTQTVEEITLRKKMQDDIANFIQKKDYAGLQSQLLGIQNDIREGKIAPEQVPLYADQMDSLKSAMNQMRSGAGVGGAAAKVRKYNPQTGKIE